MTIVCRIPVLMVYRIGKGFNMAYFSNGTEGMIYEETYCQHCIHYDHCPILNEHFLHNYSDDIKHRAVLDWLIPRKKDGAGNEKCTMFYKGTPEKQEPHIPLKGPVCRLLNRVVIKAMEESGEV